MKPSASYYTSDFLLYIILVYSLVSHAFPFHCERHILALELKIAISSVLQGSGRKGHSMLYSFPWGSSPKSRSVSSFRRFAFLGQYDLEKNRRIPYVGCVPMYKKTNPSWTNSEINYPPSAVGWLRHKDLLLGSSGLGTVRLDSGELGIHRGKIIFRNQWLYCYYIW